VIVPLRTKGGQRRYTLQHLFVIEEIKRLKQKGLNLKDINAALNYRFSSHENNLKGSSVDDLADHIAQVVRSSIVTFLGGKVIE
ncbi:MAG: MerR family transcriptional regulator, partial [Deltaproteobacteria bacterium]